MSLIVNSKANLLGEYIHAKYFDYLMYGLNHSDTGVPTFGGEATINDIF